MKCYEKLTSLQSREKRTVWMGLCADGTVLRPFVFEGSVSGANYLEMLNENVFPVRMETYRNQFNNGKFQRLWWAQDGARAPGSVEVSEWLSEFFGGHAIALNHSNECPPRSPDLTPCDYSL